MLNPIFGWLFVIAALVSLKSIPAHAKGVEEQEKKEQVAQDSGGEDVAALVLDEDDEAADD